MIQFIGKRTIPSSIDHSPRVHPASPTSSLPAGFVESQSQASTTTSFSAYRQSAQQHGPLSKSVYTSGIGALSGQSLGSVAPSKGQAFDRNELPERFRRARIDLSEIDAIETAGATLVC